LSRFGERDGGDESSHRKGEVRFRMCVCVVDIFHIWTRFGEEKIHMIHMLLYFFFFVLVSGMIEERSRCDIKRRWV
jgi:hypothetical protein